MVETLGIAPRSEVFLIKNLRAYPLFCQGRLSRDLRLTEKADRDHLALC